MVERGGWAEATLYIKMKGRISELVERFQKVESPEETGTGRLSRKKRNHNPVDHGVQTRMNVVKGLGG